MEDEKYYEIILETTARTTRFVASTNLEDAKKEAIESTMAYGYMDDWGRCGEIKIVIVECNGEIVEQ